MSATQQLASFAHGLELAQVPASVVDKVKMHTLDLLGAALVGAELPWILPVRKYCLRFGASGTSTIIGRGGEQMDAECAALANGTAGHACEIDDYHVGTGHPSCTSVASTLAVAEEQSASGADYLAASIVAFEVTSRIAVAATPSYLIDRGFHNVSTFGAFGAAASAARLLELDADQFVHALAIAGSHASGLIEYAQSGGEIKRAHAGMGAASGIRSARLAALGLTGPRTVLEGKRGFLQAFSAHPEPQLLADRLGEEWALMGSRLKPYSCCGAIFQHVDALNAILREHRLRPDDIREISVGIDRLSDSVVNTIGPEPADMASAQFSLHYSLGMAVAKGSNEFWTYLDAASRQFKDADTLDVARRVRVHLDPECDAAFPTWLSKVAVTTATGQVLTARAHGKRDLPRSEAEQKFRALTSRCISANRAEALMDCVEQLEKLTSIRELTNLLRIDVS